MSIRYTGFHTDDSIRPDGITRRSFLAAGGAAALSFFLPSIGPVGDGYAYAIETGSVGASGQPEFDIYVITREEIGISVIDVTNNSKTHVTGASVTLASSKGNASATVVADENGLAVFNLKTSGLGMPIELEGVGSSYRFEGSIKTTVPGQDDVWMDFETGRMRADGGSAVQTPLRQRANQTDPFFTMLSFDGWDFLYTENGAVETRKNKDDHTFAGKLYVPKGTKAKVELIAQVRDEEDIVIFAKDLDVTNNVAEFSQTARYLHLKKDNAALLPDDRTYVYRVTVDDGKPYVMKTKFSVQEAPVDEPVFRTQKLTPGVQSMGTFDLPADVCSPLGGMSLNVWLPSFPFIGWVNPIGFAFFGATLSANVKNSANFSDPDDWKFETRKSSEDQLDALDEKWDRAIEKYLNTPSMFDSNASVKDKFDINRSISLNIITQAYLLAEWSHKSKVWDLSFNCLVYTKLALEAMARMNIGILPIFLIVNLSLGSKISVSLGMEMESFDVSTIRFPRTSGLGYTATIAVALTLGAGIPGLLSGSLRGSGYLAFYTGFDATKVVPHVSVGFGFSAEAVVQALLFTWTGKLWGYSIDPIYDNAVDSLQDPGSLQAAQHDLSSGTTHFALGTDSAGNPVYSHDTPFDFNKGLSIEEFVKQSSIVTEATLHETRELKGVRTANASLLSEGDEPTVTLLEDGIALVDLSGMAASYASRLAANADEQAEFSYEYVGEDLDAVCSVADGIEGIAETGGVVPSKDTKIATKIFGNPNCKVVVFMEMPYMFRLVSVDLDDNGTTKTRTRLSVQRLNSNGKWTSPEVLEFRNFNLSGTERIDSFDYDFDVFANEHAGTGLTETGLSVVLISGTRPKGDDTDFLSASNATLMTIAVFDAGLRCIMSHTWKDVPGSASAPYQALMLPRIAPVNTSGNADSMGIAMLYMRRTADSADQVLGTNAHVTAEYGILQSALLYLGGREEIDPSTYEITIFENSKRASTEASFSFAAHSNAGLNISTVFPRRGGKALTAETAAMLKDGSLGSNVTFVTKHNIKNAPGLENTRPWPRRPAVLIPEDGVLTALSFDPNVENGTFEKTQIGPSDAKITTFVVSPSGQTLFYFVNQEGTMPKNGNTAEKTDKEKVSRHTIYACALVDGLFSNPFPLATTKHAVDSLDNSYSGGTYSFIATCITSMTKNSADMYYIDVPAVATATPLGFVAENDFVCAGAEDEPFFLELRNDGNVILTGCTVELRDADRPEPDNVASTRVGFRFDKANLTGSVWNPELLVSAYDGEEFAEAQAEAAAQAQGEGARTGSAAEDAETVGAQVQAEAAAVRAQRAGAQAEPAAAAYPAESLEALGIDGDHVLANPGSAGVLLPGKSGQYRITFDIPASWKSGHKNVYITMKDFMYDTLKLGEGADDVVQHPSTLNVEDAHRVTVSTARPESDDDLGDAVLAVEGETPGTGEPGESGGTPGTNSGEGGPGAAVVTKPGGSQLGDLNVPSLARSGDSAALSLAGLAAAAAVAGLTAYSARRQANEQDASQDSLDEGA